MKSLSNGVDGKSNPSALIGCAGWALPRAEQTHFVGPGSHLERYASVLPAVEINSTFHRAHRPETYARWHASVPPEFRFSVKMPKEITHKCRLEGAQELIVEFLGDVEALGEKLGCLLVQAPTQPRFRPCRRAAVLCLSPRTYRNAPRL